MAISLQNVPLFSRDDYLSAREVEGNKDDCYPNRNNLIECLDDLEKLNLPEQRTNFEFQKLNSNKALIIGLLILGSILITFYYIGSSIIDHRMIGSFGISGFIISAISLLLMIKKD